MRNAIAIAAAFCIGSTFIACSSEDPKPAPAVVEAPKPAEPVPAVNTWTLTLQSDCRNNDAGNCVAGYGFSVLSDGRYQAGPGPNGEMRDGMVTADELNAIHSALALIVSSSSSGPGNQESIDDLGTDDTVTLSQSLVPEGPKTLIKIQGTEMSYLTPSLDQAKQLLSTLQEMAVKYYDLPFPDACADSSRALTSLLSSLQTCSTDADCAYFNTSMEVVDAKSNEYITTDDCTFLRTIGVGNAGAVKANKSKIDAAMETIRNNCGNALYRSNCEGVTGFQLTGAAAVCQQGVCKAPN